MYTLLLPMVVVTQHVNKLHTNNTYCTVRHKVYNIHSDTFPLKVLEAGCIEHSEFDACV